MNASRNLSISTQNKTALLHAICRENEQHTDRKYPSMRRTQFLKINMKMNLTLIFIVQNTSGNIRNNNNMKLVSPLNLQRKISKNKNVPTYKKRKQLIKMIHVRKLRLKILIDQRAGRGSHFPTLSNNYRIHPTPSPKKKRLQWTSDTPLTIHTHKRSIRSRSESIENAFQELLIKWIHACPNHIAVDDGWRKL